MLSELDESIRQLLIKAGGFDPAEVDVSFELPSREWSTSISKPTLNCYLFDMHENPTLRQQGVQPERQASGLNVRRTPRLYFDLTYLITAWTRVVEDEHRLLWHTLRTLLRFPALSSEFLQGTLRELEVPVLARTAQPDGVLKSPGEFWGALENHIKPSLAYVLTLAIDRDVLPAGPPVLTTSFRIGQLDNVSEETLWFGGVVRNDQGVPLGGATVTVEGRALQAHTDNVGQFRLRLPAPGRYTLIASLADKHRRVEIDVPSTQYDIAI